MLYQIYIIAVLPLRLVHRHDETRKRRRLPRPPLLKTAGRFLHHPSSPPRSISHTEINANEHNQLTIREQQKMSIATRKTGSI